MRPVSSSPSTASRVESSISAASSTRITLGRCSIVNLLPTYSWICYSGWVRNPLPTTDYGLKPATLLCAEHGMLRHHGQLVLARLYGQTACRIRPVHHVTVRY